MSDVASQEEKPTMGLFSFDTEFHSYYTEARQRVPSQKIIHG
jgi:hypothetical protein